MPHRKAKSTIANISSSIESEDFSLETTVPTEDLWSSDEKDVAGKVTKQLLERKELLHNLQRLKIELSQKKMLIDNIEVNYITKTEELQERLNDALHQKQVLALRLENQLESQQDENWKQQALRKQEMDTIMLRQKQLEEINRQLCDRAGDLRRSLRDLELSEEKYRKLKDLPEEKLSIPDYVAIRFYEVVNPLRALVTELQVKKTSLTEDLLCQRKHIQSLIESSESERSAHSELELSNQRLTQELADTKLHIREGDYKQLNYDKVNRERNAYEKEVRELRKKLETVEHTNASLNKAKNELTQEVVTLQQSLTLLSNDKDYLNKQNLELKVRCTHQENCLERLQIQIEDTKKARDESYEKYVHSRELYQTEYENKLHNELEQIRVKSSHEIENLQRASKEMYERENRTLRENRDNAFIEKDRALTAQREIQDKYNQLQDQFKQLQLNSDSRVADLLNQVKMKAFEFQRCQIIQEETSRNFSLCQVECEKLHKKIEVLNKEFYGLLTSSEKKISELQAQKCEQQAQLDVYRRSEQDMDDITVQAAEMEDEEEAERVLLSYGHGANIATTAKRRLKQSVQLARRVLQLERRNTQLTRDLESQTAHGCRVSEQLDMANQLLGQVQQPHSYLIETARQRDAQILSMKDQIKQLEQDISDLKKEKTTLLKVKNSMAADLEKLLKNREELTVMKQVLISMGSQQHGRPVSLNPANLNLAPATSVHRLEPLKRTEEPPSDQGPQPTLFINKKPPALCRNLKRTTK